MTLIQINEVPPLGAGPRAAKELYGNLVRHQMS